MYTSKQEFNSFYEDYKRSMIINVVMVEKVLKEINNYENKYNKTFYTFSVTEILNMYKDLSAISIVTLKNWNTTLNHAARYILYNQGKDTENNYEKISHEQLQSCISIDTNQFILLTRRQITEIQDQLYNWTDKAILELLFLGLGCPFLDEIIFFELSQIDKENMQVNLKNGKKISVDERGYNILQNAFNEKTIVFCNDEQDLFESKQLEGTGLIKLFKENTSNTKDIKEKYKWINNQIVEITNFVKVPLTVGSILDSGKKSRK